MKMIVCKLFFCFFLSLFTAPINKNIDIKAKFYFIFLKNVLKQTWKSFNTKFRLRQKIGKVVTR